MTAYPTPLVLHHDVVTAETFRVVCRDTAHDEEVLVAVFDLAAGDRIATPDETFGDTSTARGRRSTSRALDHDDHVVEHAPTTEDEADAVARHRDRFECLACGVTVEARAEVLDPIVRTAVDRGVDEVTLALLGVLVADEARRRRSQLH